MKRSAVLIDIANDKPVLLDNFGTLFLVLDINQDGTDAHSRNEMQRSCGVGE